MQGILYALRFLFLINTHMITAKNGKRYLTSDDVKKLVYNCELTKKLEELQRRAEVHYLNKEDNKPTKKGLFSKVKDTAENKEILENLGILNDTKEGMVSDMQDIMTEVDTKWSEIITPGLYASSKEYSEIREHYLKLRGECWKTLALILNYNIANRCMPVAVWM